MQCHDVASMLRRHCIDVMCLLGMMWSITVIGLTAPHGICFQIINGILLNIRTFEASGDLYKNDTAKDKNDTTKQARDAGAASPRRRCNVDATLWEQPVRTWQVSTRIKLCVTSFSVRF